MNLSAVISEVNLVGGNTKEWWMDTGATRYVCSEKKMFSTYNAVGNGGKIFMGNFSTSRLKELERLCSKWLQAGFLLWKMYSMCQKYKRTLYLAHCWARIVSSWSLNLIIFHSLRVECMWVKDIGAMACLRWM